MNRRSFRLGNIEAVIFEADGVPSLTIVPSGMTASIVSGKQGSCSCLAQTHIRGASHRLPYAKGLTMLGSETSFAYRLESCEESGGALQIRLRNDNGLVYEQTLTPAGEAVVCAQSLKNEGGEACQIEHVSSFCLSCLTPFDEGMAPDQLKLHRFTSFWSSEGRHRCETLEELNMETSWSKWIPKVTRIAQIGSMPVRGYFPTMGLEDEKNGVTWAVNLAWAGSWSMELFRQKDDAVLCGGLAGFDQGHFRKTLLPGETLALPAATMTVVRGGIDAACEALLSAQAAQLEIRGSAEAEAAPLYNEYLDTWGKPTEETVRDEMKAVKSLGLSYFVIDAGWYGTSEDWGVSIGDWQIRKSAFPNGLKKITEEIRQNGMIPGIWFEAEVASDRSDVFRDRPEMFMRDDGRAIIQTNRAFLNLTRDDAQAYLDEKIISFLRDNGFGYVKIDYNDTYGLGFDGFESLGEANRRQTLGTYRFFDRMREQLPDLIVENCASGGHRLEMSMMQRCSMASFSDAHECEDIPLIAADLHRLILPRQSQVWACVRPEDSDRRIVWSMSAAMLGRMCLSGPLNRLNGAQLARVREGVDFYKAVAPLILEGSTRVYRAGITGYDHAHGWQCVVRRGKKKAVAVIHAFEKNGGSFTVPAELSGYGIARVYADRTCGAALCDGTLSVHGDGEYFAAALLLEKGRS